MKKFEFELGGNFSKLELIAKLFNQLAIRERNVTVEVKEEKGMEYLYLLVKKSKDSFVEINLPIKNSNIHGVISTKELVLIDTDNKKISVNIYSPDSQVSDTDNVNIDIITSNKMRSSLTLNISFKLAESCKSGTELTKIFNFILQEKKHMYMRVLMQRNLEIIFQDDDLYLPMLRVKFSLKTLPADMSILTNINMMLARDHVDVMYCFNYEGKENTLEFRAICLNP